MLYRCSVIYFAVAGGLVLGATGASYATVMPDGSGEIYHAIVQSSNWCGYYVEVSGGTTVNYVQGTWTVPAIVDTSFGDFNLSITDES